MLCQSCAAGDSAASVFVFNYHEFSRVNCQHIKAHPLADLILNIYDLWVADKEGVLKIPLRFRMGKEPRIHLPHQKRQIRRVGFSRIRFKLTDNFISGRIGFIQTVFRVKSELVMSTALLCDLQKAPAFIIDTDVPAANLQR